MIRTQSSGGSSRRVVVVATSTAEIARLLPLIARLTGQRHQVLCLAERCQESDALLVAEAGARLGTFSLSPEGFTLMPQRQVIGRLADAIAETAPRVCLVLGHGEMLAAACLAARKAKAGRVIALIDRVPQSPSKAAGRTAAEDGRAMIRALEVTDAVVCQNHDHAAQLEVRGFIAKGRTPPIVVPGLGVDVEAVRPAALPPLSSGLMFVSFGGPSPGSGAREFCAAAAELKARAPHARFRLVWREDPDAREAAGVDAVSLHDLAADREAVEIVIEPQDSRLGHLAECHVMVGAGTDEAMPQGVLEALAVGRPVIACDAPGSRETIDERVNGCLVAPEDAGALAVAMGSFLKRPDLIASMSRASRLKAERRFDRRLALEAMTSVLQL